MRVRISDIGPKGLKVNDTIALEGLNTRMNESRSNDIIFKKNPEVELEIHTTPHGAQVKGKARAFFLQPCSLCVEEIERETEVTLDYVFQRKSEMQLAERDAPGNEYYDDIGICYFSGEHLELEELIQETIILSMDPYWKPERTADGHCTYCGEDCRKLLSVNS